MVFLITGMALWAVVHFIPSLAPGVKQSWLNKLGEGGYKGTFSLLLLAALGLIVFGWRNSAPVFVYLPPAELRPVALALMLLAFVLLALTKLPSYLKTWVRHPQLSGVAVWGVAHLLLNGDSRSLVLFGGMACWAVVEIFAISHREGAWVKSAPPGWGQEVLSLMAGLVTYLVFMFLHPYLAGVPVF